MRTEVQELEWRKFLGLDSRADETLVPIEYQTYTNNVILQKGVILSKKGYEQWGTLDHSSIAGVLHQIQFFDIGDVEYVVIHKGTGIYYGVKTDTSYTQIDDLAASPYTVYDEESELSPYGYNVGSNGKLLYKILLKQQSGCAIIEFNDGSWVARAPGISNSNITFSLSDTGSGDTLEGFYRVRVTARRVQNGVRVNESAHVGKSSSADDRFFQEIEVPSGGGTIQITVADSSPDAQTTHYGVQITRVLDLVGDSDYSRNENDPYMYFEAIELTSGQLGSPVTIPTDTNDLEVVAPNMTGHLPLPGHLISVVAGNLTFFAGIGDHKNRIYHSGISGFFYHSELYDPYTFTSGGDDDGQLITGLGSVQDHLVVIKEAKTGILANRALGNVITWRDYRLGATHRNAFANISEDEMVIHNQDGIFRLFNGIRYDREATIAESIYGYSENIRTISEEIDSSTISYVYDQERMHVLHGDSESRDVLVFHPRDFYGWTRWEQTEMNKVFKAANGSLWVFEKAGLLYLQNPSDAVYTDDGLDITWEVTFAMLTSQKSRKDKVLLKIAGVEADLDNPLYSSIKVDGGRIETDFYKAFPDPADGVVNPWYQLYLGPNQISGNYVEITLRGVGRAVIRGIYLGIIEKKSGNLGWSQATFNPDDWTTPYHYILDAEDEERDV